MVVSGVCFVTMKLGRVVCQMTLVCLSGGWLPPSYAQDAKPGISPVLQTLCDLWEYEHAGRPSSQRLSFEFPETYINLYLSTSLKLNPRPGLSSLSVELLPSDRMVATARVDILRLMADDPSMIPSNLRPQLIRSSFLKAEFTFRVESGRLTFAVKPVASDGLEVPGPVLEKIVRRLAFIQPEKLDTSRPITLPWGMKELYTQAKLLGGGT